MVRSYAAEMPETIRKLYDSLELEEGKIEWDLAIHSKKKTSKKRKASDVAELNPVVKKRNICGGERDKDEEICLRPKEK